MITIRYQLQIFLVVQFLIFVEKVHGVNNMEVGAYASEKVVKYVSSLIKIESSKDSSKNHDVVFIQMEQTYDNELLDEISHGVLKNNPWNTVFYHSENLSSWVDLESIIGNRIHAASVFVIGTEITKQVRSLR